MKFYLHGMRVKTWSLSIIVSAVLAINIINSLTLGFYDNHGNSNGQQLDIKQIHLSYKLNA